MAKHSKNTKGWSISSELIINEGLNSFGCSVSKICLEKNLFSLSKDGKEFFSKNIDCGLNSAYGSKVAEDKQLTYMLLDKFGIPYPSYSYLDDNGDDLKLSNESSFSWPYVVKPVDGAHGDGVSTGLMSISQLKDAIKIARGFSDRVLLQEHIEGDDHRILVVGDSVVAAARRMPPQIIGNGVRSIKELINDENENNPLRGSGDHAAALSYIKIDDIMKEYLGSHQKSLDTVLPLGEVCQVRPNSNLSTGGSSVDVTDLLPVDLIEASVNAAKACGLVVAGIDFMAKDISLGLAGGAKIIEINATPGLRMHHYPSEGTSRNVAHSILTELFSRG